MQFEKSDPLMNAYICLPVIQDTASNWELWQLFWSDASSSLVAVSRPPPGQQLPCPLISKCQHCSEDGLSGILEGKLQSSVCSSNLYPTCAWTKYRQGLPIARDRHENWSSEANHMFCVEDQNKTESLPNFKKVSCMKWKGGFNLSFGCCFLAEDYSSNNNK